MFVFVLNIWSNKTKLLNKNLKKQCCARVRLCVVCVCVCVCVCVYTQKKTFDEVWLLGGQLMFIL